MGGSGRHELAGAGEVLASGGGIGRTVRTWTIGSYEYFIVGNARDPCSDSRDVGVFLSGGRNRKCEMFYVLMKEKLFGNCGPTKTNRIRSYCPLAP